VFRFWWHFKLAKYFRNFWRNFWQYFASSGSYVPVPKKIYLRNCKYLKRFNLRAVRVYDTYITQNVSMKCIIDSYKQFFFWFLGPDWYRRARVYRRFKARMSLPGVRLCSSVNSTIVGVWHVIRLSCNRYEGSQPVLLRCSAGCSWGIYGGITSIHRDVLPLQVLGDISSRLVLISWY